MGKKVFSSRVLRNPDLKRNSIDLSRINHMTTKIGQLTPCFLQEVVPGDSINIKADFGFRFMPMAFPVQSPIRADIHFFYVRTRTLWDNFTAFRFDTIKGVEHPFIKTTDNTFFANGSLSDYLGVPTTQFQSEDSYQVIQRITEEEARNLVPNPYSQNSGAVVYAGRGAAMIGAQEIYPYPQELGVLFLSEPVGSVLKLKIGHKFSEYLGSDLPMLMFSNSITLSSDSNKFEFFIDFPESVSDSVKESFRFIFYSKNQGMIKEDAIVAGELNDITLIRSETRSFIDGDNTSVVVRKYYEGVSIIGSAGAYRGQNLYKFFDENPNIQIALVFSDKRVLYYLDENKVVHFYGINNIQIGVKTSSEIPVTESPFAVQTGQTTPRIPISSLPFRAYEACYNSFFRNTIVSPFKKKVVVNGVETEQEVFDDYVTTKADGADETPYKLYQRNWEKDVYTSAWKTPQFGASQPLIGATSSNQPFEVQQMKIKDGSTTKTIQILVGDDKKVVGLSRYSSEFPLSSIDALNSAIEYGISINDLRNVDALQIWLENNVANGYKYKDEMLSHFGVNVDFSILSMPEYIGGVSRHLNVNTIYQSIETEQNPIGSFGGVGNITGNTEYDINKYCEEDGFIIGILSIVPIPSYSQLLPRVFQKSHFLDYFNPEFSHIGMQPIFKKDISPLTTDSSNQNEVFGYTKPNWEYLQAVDEIHGDFRDKLRNFVINREFANTPSLVQDFIEIKPTEVNDIFSYRENTDKIVGMVSFKCTAKRPIPIMLNPQIK